MNKSRSQADIPPKDGKEIDVLLVTAMDVMAQRNAVIFFGWVKSAAAVTSVAVQFAAETPEAAAAIATLIAPYLRSTKIS